VLYVPEMRESQISVVVLNRRCALRYVVQLFSLIVNFKVSFATVKHPSSHIGKIQDLYLEPLSPTIIIVI
jgi:hypothetical protein